MTRFSDGEDLAIVSLSSNAAISATTEFNYVDTNGYESCMIVAIERAITATSSAYITPALMSASVTPTSTANYTADTNFNGGSGTSATITAAVTPSTVVHKWAYTGNKRYLQIKATATSTGNGAWQVFAILGRNRHQPSVLDAPTSGTVT